MLASPPRLNPTPPQAELSTKTPPPLEVELAELAAMNDKGGPGYYNGAEASGTARTGRCPPPPPLPHTRPSETQHWKKVGFSILSEIQGFQSGSK